MKFKTYMYRLRKDIPGYQNKRPGKDAGYDLFAAETKWFLPFQTRKVLSNACVHIPAGHLGRIKGRSGESLNGWLVHPGTVDHGYHGDIGIIVTNLSFLPRRIKEGTRPAQLIFMPFSEATEIEELDNREDYNAIVKRLSNSDRGDGGFGESGK